MRLEMLRAEAAAGHVDDDRLDLDLRHPLGGVDRLADRPFGGFEIDDGTALEAVRALMSDADDAGEMGPSAQGGESLGRLELGDEADDLARADVEHREDGAPARGERFHTRR